MYVPEQGEILRLNFNPVLGHEQAGYRPALVVSNYDTNLRTQMALLCPITNTDNGFPLHVRLDDSVTTTGVILCEQVKSIDIYSRGAQPTGEKISETLLAEIIDILTGMIEIVI